LPKRRATASSKPSRLPSETEILEFVQGQEGRVGKREIARAFKISGADRIDLKRLLRKMADQGLLEKDRKRLRKSGTIPPIAVLEVTGTDSDGDLIAKPVNWDADAHGDPPAILILPSKQRGAASKAPGVGDRVLAKLSKVTDGARDPYQYEARTIRVISRTGRTLLGIFRKAKGGDMRIEPVDKKNRNELSVSRGDDGGAQNGELVAVEVTRDRGRGLTNARVTERLGKPGGQHAVSIIAIHQHGLRHKFGGDVLAEVERMKPARLGGRTDMRSVPLITIDPPDARDHDDAVWAAPDDDPKNKGGFRVIVAIADVAHYLRHGSALEREARERGNSTYFPDRVVPMLPERLSADLCSLRANEDRPALAVTMVFDRNGAKKSHEFSRVLMRSAAKLSYDQAQAAIDGRPDDVTGPLLGPILKPLWAAYRTVAKARDKRAPLDLDLPERKILFNDKGEIDRIVVPPRLDCHRLIEEFMILANVCAAETLEQKRSPLLYRVHESPADEKVRALSEFLSTLGLKLALGQGLKPKVFNQILAKVKGKDVEQLVNDVVLRSQAQAVYSPENRGHFGLNLRRYAHFTSPIRRYADVIVHRSLISALSLGDGGLDDNDVAQLYETAELISAAERRSMLAERDTVDRLVAAHLADKVGAQFNGRIAGVTDAGLFVALEDTGANGFVPARTIGTDYFIHDRDHHALIGEKTGETFRLGDQVEVRLVEVAPLAGGLRFELLSPGAKGKPVGRRGGRDGSPIRQRRGASRRRR